MKTSKKSFPIYYRIDPTKRDGAKFNYWEIWKRYPTEEKRDQAFDAIQKKYDLFEFKK